MRSDVVRYRHLVFTALLILFSTNAFAQSGGNLVITESVVAGGGGQNSAGGTFSVDGTVGQAAGGNAVAGAPFAVTSGFWTYSPLAPTAAHVFVGGRILSADGRGVRNVIVSLTDMSGMVSRIARSSSFGYYRFDDVEVGGTYVVSAVSKQYLFAPRFVNVLDELVDLDLIAEP